MKVTDLKKLNFLHLSKENWVWTFYISISNISNNFRCRKDQNNSCKLTLFSFDIISPWKLRLNYVAGSAARRYSAGYRTSLLSQSQVTSEGSDQSQIWSQKLWNVCIASRHATLWDFWPSGRQINFIFGQRVNHHWLSPAGATITRCPVKKRHEHPAKGQGISRGWRRCMIERVNHGDVTGAVTGHVLAAASPSRDRSRLAAAVYWGLV